MEAWTAIVRDMQRIRVGKDGKPGAVEKFAADPKDSWETWNRMRNDYVKPVVGEAKP
jgi:hypothetical protein